MIDRGVASDDIDAMEARDGLNHQRYRKAPVSPWHRDKAVFLKTFSNPPPIIRCKSAQVMVSDLRMDANRALDPNAATTATSGAIIDETKKKRARVGEERRDA